MYSRLTTATMYGSLMTSLQDSMRSLQDLQKQIATGNKYTRLSDNPAAISQSLSLQSALNANETYQANTQNAITMLRYGDAAMNNVLDAAQAIRSLVIQAGNGSLDSYQLQDITAQIEANKKIILDNLNTRISGQYIFGGTDTSTRPFVEQSDGSIIYQGNDERIKYAVNDSLLGDVTFSGNDIVPTNENSYFICSHYVPVDWAWTGREEKVQITVGNRTLSVFIPEDWSDNDTMKTNSDNMNYTDGNGYRDPNEVSGLSLDDIAGIVNRSLEDHGADMLVKVYVEKDYENNRQQLIMKSNTGEKIGITGWPDTDYMPMPASITSKDLDGVDWKDGEGSTNGLMGNANIMNWKGGTDSGELTITVNGKTYDPIDLSGIKSSSSLVEKINDLIHAGTSDTMFASMSAGKLSGRLMLNSDAGSISVSGTGNAMSELFGIPDDETLNSTQSSFTISTGDDNSAKVKIYINDSDTLEDLADRINGIEGVSARTNSSGNNLVITAQRTGALPSDRLAINDSEEALNYPSLTIKGDGGALKIFDFGKGTSVKVEPDNRLIDHSHMDVFDVLGMETAMKSREFQENEKLVVAEGTQLHWRVISGGRAADVKLNAGEYDIDTLAERLANAGAGWLEVSVSEDTNDDYGTFTENGEVIGKATLDAEAVTKRLVIRGYDAEQVIFLDMNEYNYADQMGLSTALRTDGYTETMNGTGTRCVNFPSAPCVDDNVGVPIRVQMNCGTYYDVDLKKAYVVDPKTGFVDRNKVMQAIVDGVNEQEGYDIMGCTVHIDRYGAEIADSSAIYFLSGEAFTLVDIPFNDPEWSDYSGGIAAQMGIHGGVTSNLKQTKVPMKDNATFEEAYGSASADFREGTIRFSNLAHEVEIDVSATDTVKDIVDRLRIQAGDWLYVNYYDEHMGQVDTRNTGDYPLISISSVDGSAVNVLDVKGHIAQDALGLSTGIQTRLNPAGDEGDETGIRAFKWDIGNDEAELPATTLTLTVAGYEHTIDLTAIRDVTFSDINSDYLVDARDVAEFINARMQDYDVKAEVNQDNELMIWSLRGYSVEMKFMKDDADVTAAFRGSEASARTYYRGGYNLEGSADTRGVDAGSFYGSGIHTQNATIRSGANTMRQNGFGVINDIVAAIEAGNRDDLSDKMLPRLDDFINNILSVMAEDGALQARYTYNTERLVTESAIMDEQYDNLVKIDPADAISQLMIADYMYQANLAVISRLIQPTLLDFLS